MLAQRVITATQFRSYVRKPMPNPHDVHLSGVLGQSPYFGEYVKSQLIDRFGAKSVFGSGFRVYTTIDLRLQKLARAAIHKWLPSPDGPQAALVAINPTTGAVLAMYGGNSFHTSQFNLAVQGERQPGSAFKPFVLADRAEAGHLAADHVRVEADLDLPRQPLLERAQLRGRVPRAGSISRTRSPSSDNSVFAQLTKVVGPAERRAYRARDGDRRAPCRATSQSVSASRRSTRSRWRAPTATFANGGYRVDGSVFGNEPRAIATITDSKGDVVYANDPRSKQVLTSSEDELLTQLLEGVVTVGHRHAAALPDRPVAGKTGTTENYGDAWFVGYTPQLVTAVWVGYPKGLRPMLTEFHGRPVAGGTFPAQIWKSFMEPALERRRSAAGALPLAAVSSRWRRNASRIATVGSRLDNGRCRGISLLVYFSGAGRRDRELQA